MTGEFFRSKRWPRRCDGERKVWWRVHGQVDQNACAGTANDHPAEGIAVIDPLHGPTPLADRSLQCIARDGTCPRSGAVKKSRSSVARDVRCCASRPLPLPGGSPCWRAERRTAWPTLAGKPTDPADYLPPLRRSLAAGRDQRRPRRPNRARQNKVLPQVSQQRAIDVSQDVGGRSLLRDDLVHPGPVGPGPKVEHAPWRRPVQVQRQLHHRQRPRHVQPRQPIRNPHRLSARGRLLTE